MDQDAKRFGEPGEFAVAIGWRNASGYFSSASSDFKALGALFCNSTTLFHFQHLLEGTVRMFCRNFNMLQGFPKLESPF